MSDLRTIAALDELDKLTEEWWTECGLDAAVNQIAETVPGAFKARTYSMLAALLKQSHVEGLYRGYEKAKEGQSE